MGSIVRVVLFRVLMVSLQGLLFGVMRGKEPAYVISFLFPSCSQFPKWEKHLHRLEVTQATPIGASGIKRQCDKTKNNFCQHRCLFAALP